MARVSLQVGRRQRLAATSSRQLECRFNPIQHELELALRGRAGRRVRACLRRLEPVVLHTPRWSRSTEFLEDISMDLALELPTVGCRHLRCGPLRGRGVAVARNAVLQATAQLGRPGWEPVAVPLVADRTGFRYVLDQLIKRAHDEAPHRVAFMASDVQDLPHEVLEDLRECWAAYRERQPATRRCTVLLAASSSAHWVRVGDVRPVSLRDFGQDEAVEAIKLRTGIDRIPGLEQAVAFSGGIPEAVVQIADRVLSGESLLCAEDALAFSLPIAESVRASMEAVCAEDAVSERLYELAAAGELPRIPEDERLLDAGLVIERRARGADVSGLRAPIIGALLP